MANVLYVDTGALKRLAAAGGFPLLNSLLDTGRRVVITTSVLDELNSGSPLPKSNRIAASWVDRNFALGNLQEAVTTEAGPGSGERSIANLIMANPADNSFAISEDQAGINRIFAATAAVGSPAPVSLLSFLSQEVLSGQLSYGAAVAGINNIIGSPGAIADDAA